MNEKSHIRFLSNNRTVCEKPLLLGHDFVVLDYTGKESCQDCLALIHAYNARTRQYDLLVELPQEPYLEKPVLDIRELWKGVIVSSIIWVLILCLTIYILRFV